MKRKRNGETERERERERERGREGERKRERESKKRVRERERMRNWQSMRHRIVAAKRRRTTKPAFAALKRVNRRALVDLPVKKKK